MKKKIIFIKNSACDHVRVLKFNKVFRKNGIDTSFIGWDRIPNSASGNCTEYKDVTYLLQGGGFGGSKLAFYYLLWVIKLLFWNITRKKDDAEILFAIDFDSALPLYLSSLLGSKSKYIYDIHDDFSFRYQWPQSIKKIITFIDYKVKERSLKTIHVDNNRVREKDSNYVIINNTPIDFFKTFKEPNYQPTLAAVGHLSEIRGLLPILEFAEKHPSFGLIIAGKQVFSKEIEERISSCQNISMYPRMPQNDLFEIIKNCSGIYSLYDPKIEINIKAASNKLYDAMMLGIPVIVNREIEASHLVEQKDLGFIVNYEFDSSWGTLKDNLMDLSIVKNKGLNGRELYEGSLNFENQVLNGIIQPLLS